MPARRGGSASYSNSAQATFSDALTAGLHRHQRYGDPESARRVASGGRPRVRVHQYDEHVAISLEVVLSKAFEDLSQIAAVEKTQKSLALEAGDRSRARDWRNVLQRCGAALFDSNG